MFAWIGRVFFGRKKKEEPKSQGFGIIPGKDGSDCFTSPRDHYSEHFLKPNGQWEPPEVQPNPPAYPHPKAQMRLEQLGARMHTDHPATESNERHRLRRTMEQLAAKEKEVRPTATIFPRRTPHMTPVPNRAPQLGGPRTTHNPSNPTYNPSNRPQPWKASSNHPNPQERYAGHMYNSDSYSPGGPPPIGGMHMHSSIEVDLPHLFQCDATPVYGDSATIDTNCPADPAPYVPD